jgi:O-antigen/teichoic acid export membrane protein
MGERHVSELDDVAGKSARGSFYLFVGVFLSELINAVGAVIVARLLTPQEYGVFGLSLVLPGIFLMFSNWGIAEALTRFLTRYQAEGRWGDIKRMTRTGLIFNGTLACMLSLIMYVLADPLASMVLVRPELGDLVMLSSAIVIIQTVFATSSSILLGLERMDLVAAMMVIQAAIKASASPLLIRYGYRVSGAVAGYMISTLVVALLSVIVIARHLWARRAPSQDETEESSLRGMLSFGFPLFMSNFVGGVNLRYRGLLQAWFATDLAIGNLNIATKFRSLVGLFTSPIIWTLYPAFSKFRYGERKGELESMFRNSIRYATIIVLPAVCLIAIMSKPLVVTLFGTGYEQAPFFLVLALMEYLAVGLGSLSIMGFLNSQGETKTTFHLNSVSVTISVALCTVLTWMWSIPGLLAGVFLSSMAGYGYSLYKVSEKYGMRIDLLHTGRVALFSAPSALVTIAVMDRIGVSNTFVHMALGSGIFLLACMMLAPLMGAVDVRDVQTIRRIIRRETALYPLVAPFLDLEERILRFENSHLSGK